MACTQTLTAISRQCGKVRGGISKLWVVNQDKVSITVTDGAVTAIALTAAQPAPGDGLIEFGFRPGTATVSIAGNADDSGRNMSYTTTATFEFLKQETAKRVSLQALVETDAYLIYEDMNHKRWLLGYDSPVNSNVNGESGAGVTDANLYTLVVTDSSLELPMEISMTDSAFDAILDANLEE